MKDNGVVLFTKTEIHTAIRYFKKILGLAKLQQPSLVNKLEKFVTVFEWHLKNNAFYFRRWFIRYLLNFEKPCKALYPRRYFRARVDIRNFIRDIRVRIIQ